MKMELIDSHCHLTFDELAGDIEGVIERSRAASVTEWITIGTDTRHNQKAVELAEKFPNMYAAVGIHPHYAKDVSPDDLKILRELAMKDKVVAVGETGLDFHYNFSKQPTQIRLFVQELEIAEECNLPLVVHSRQAFDETIDLLEQYGQRIRKVVFHCFSGTAEQTRLVIEKGFYVSFTGVVTFKNASDIRESAKLVPLDRMMIETDCPYMSPEPMRKQKVNEPALMIHTARFLAELKQISLEDFAGAVTKTTKNFFSLPCG